MTKLPSVEQVREGIELIEALKIAVCYPIEGKHKAKREERNKKFETALAILQAYVDGKIVPKPDGVGKCEELLKNIVANIPHHKCIEDTQRFVNVCDCVKDFMEAVYKAKKLITGSQATGEEDK